MTTRPHHPNRWTVLALALLTGCFASPYPKTNPDASDASTSMDLGADRLLPDKDAALPGETGSGADRDTSGADLPSADGAQPTASEAGRASDTDTGPAPDTNIVTVPDTGPVTDTRVSTVLDTGVPDTSVILTPDSSQAIDTPILVSPDTGLSPDTYVSVDAPSTPPPDSGSNNGEGCTTGATCASGVCVDGMCCDKSCSGTCMSCKEIHTSQANGTCAYVKVGIDPYTACSSSCSEANITINTCNGQGSCATGTPKPCDKHLKCASGSTCKTSCGTSEECTTGYHCANGACGADVTDIAVNQRTVCALVKGNVSCWGSAEGGTLGPGGSDTITPRAITGLGPVTSISASALHTCVVVGGAARCWGDNNHGDLGDGSGVESATPVQPLGLSQGVTVIDAGSANTCAIVNGAAKCWGGWGGVLGNGTTSESYTPVQVDGLTSGVVQISGGSLHVCAILDGGAVECWGDNATGQVGTGGSGGLPVLSPVSVASLNSGVTAISAGHSHTCAVVNGAAMCWGANDKGQCGGTGTDVLSPTQVPGLDAGVSAICAATYHTCAIVNGSVKCWGNGQNLGLLGDGGTNDSRVPVQVQGLTDGVTSLDCDALVTCAVVKGAVKCWGFNYFGQLGIDPKVTSYSAVPVEILVP